MIEQRKHPDIFTPEEAIAYFHLDTEGGERTLETLRTEYGLVGKRIGKGYMYHRAALDAVVNIIFGIQATARRQPTRPNDKHPRLAG